MKRVYSKWLAVAAMAVALALAVPGLAFAADMQAAETGADAPQAAKLADGTYILKYAGKSGTALSNTTAKKGAQTKVAAYDATTLAERYYLRNESDGTVSLQNVGSGLFLAKKGSKLVQLADSKANTHRWKAYKASGGYTLVNEAGGSVAVSGKNAVVSTTAAGTFAFKSAKLIPNGRYTVKNKAKGRVLNVESTMFYSTKARVTVFNSNKGGNQVFKLTNKGGSTYTITCAISGYNLQVPGGSKSNGAKVAQVAAKSAKAQQWVATLERSGAITFKNRASGKLLTAAGTGKSSSLVTSTKAGTKKTQRWTLVASAYKEPPALARAYNKIKNLSSGTGYMIAVDLTNHWICIYKGGKGHWKLYKNWVVANGKRNTPTVTGDFTVQDKGYSFGHGYTCYYYTQFYGGYLFHSIKYKEGTRTPMDARLNAYISMGCVRMEIGHAKWIYSHIPRGTHVKVYN